MITGLAQLTKKVDELTRRFKTPDPQLDSISIGASGQRKTSF